MAVIDPIVTKLTDGKWQFTWAVDTAPYSVWFDGNLLASGLTTELFIYEGPGFVAQEAPAIEVLNSGDASENQTFPPRFIIQWRGLLAASAYTVEQFLGGSGGSFVEVLTVMEIGNGYYSFTSDPLKDGDSHQFRVTALSVSGAPGTPLPFTSVITRNPNPPDVDVAITAGDIVISAAA